MRGQALSEWTTLGVGGPARALVQVHDVKGLAAALSQADVGRQPVLVLGGGSNIVVHDDGFPGTVVHVGTKGVRFERHGDDVVVSAGAGEDWAGLVERCVGEGLSGTECLSGIPGLVGATPVQNVGAYGQEVSQVISSVTVWDRRAGGLDVLGPGQCRFGYRDSVFKRSDRYVVTEVSFVLQRSGSSRPVSYAQLAAHLGTELGRVAPLALVARTVMQLRRAKGMVLDPDDPDTRSVGSFFMNPILTDDQLLTLRQLDPQVPVWPASQGTKVAAARLVEMSGFAKGYAKGTAAISSKHSLALTVRPGGTAADLLALAREVRNGVRARFGVLLQPEPLLIGVYL